MSLQSTYAPGALLKQPKPDTAKKSAEDYPDEDPGYALDGAGDWPGADPEAGFAADEFPPEGEPKVDRSTGPKAVPAKERAAVPSVRGGKRGK